MTAPSPGILTRFIVDLHYNDYDKYLEALAEAMKTEYQAIVGAGFLLQIDAPDLGSARANQHRDKTEKEFLAIAEQNVEALNHAISGLPADSIRLHICWGNYEGPHTHDIALAKIIPVCFKARTRAFSFEGANPRHEHEWEDLEGDQDSRRQGADSGRDRFHHQLRRAPQAGGAAHRPLRRDRRAASA